MSDKYTKLKETYLQYVAAYKELFRKHGAHDERVVQAHRKVMNTYIDLQDAEREGQFINSQSLN